MPKIAISAKTQGILQMILFVLLTVDVTSLATVASDHTVKLIMVGIAMVCGILKALLGMNGTQFNPNGTPAEQPYSKDQKVL